MNMSSSSKLLNTKLLLPTFLSVVAALLFIAQPLFAQTPNDFNDDVKQGKDELDKDPAAQRNQKEVVDGEDGEAGEGDGQNNQEGVDEEDDIQNAENNQGVDEEDKDINNSDIDEVDDADDLDEESQEVINGHDAQEEGEGGNQQEGEKNTPGQETPEQESNQ